ncbi:hypothetical protein RFI_00965 [Reticulomyxa filosa]|uniref:CYRIA/CYRIB Rac1 binding domain-containing protein n=1 Tax=Reticulomyxa filosa TaxID=46433 RepID=X6PC51_RETFI|nr:hypothetical protein RFI_00965 [Reticulomyxa filosa]|eukprot:ETO36095.1 hypothetical protein RFI_00965 [Reticulomyxa filosa]
MDCFFFGKIPSELGDEEKKQLYKQVFDILAPQINKINGLMVFHDQMVKCFTKNLRMLVYPLEKKEPLWRDHMVVLNKMLDRMTILDALKDMKGQMKNDFAFYKRAFSFVRNILPNATDLMAEITGIHNFLNDPTRPYHIILFHMKEDIRQVPHKEELFATLMYQALSDLNGHTYLSPVEKHGLYRCLLACMYLVDDSECNVFKGGKYIPIKEVRNILRKVPYITIYLDCTTRTELMLQLCEHYSSSMESDWNSKKNAMFYNLVNWRVRIKKSIRALRQTLLPYCKSYDV